MSIGQNTPEEMADTIKFLGELPQKNAEFAQKMAKIKQEIAQQQQQSAKFWKDSHQSIRTHNVKTAVLVGVGVLAAAGVVNYLRKPKEQKQPASWVSRIEQERAQQHTRQL